MIRLTINGTPVYMTKFFKPADTQETIQSVGNAKNVLFIDTAPTAELVNTVRFLIENDVNVTLRDHHDCQHPKNDRERQINDAANTVLQLLGHNATIATREMIPGCSLLIEDGEFSNVDAVVCDADLDGLLGAMKALGTSYADIDSDAAVLDGPRTAHSAETLSPLAWDLSRAMSTLPLYNPNKPEVSENAKKVLFEEFMAATLGNTEARDKLKVRVSEYEKTVATANELAAAATEPVQSCLMVDTVGFPRYDLTTLAGSLEESGAKVTVICKDNGPIAANDKARVQYSLSVAKPFQPEINLQDLLPEGFVSSPKTGIISNTTFLLHVSKSVWEETVLPALRSKLS